MANVIFGGETFFKVSTEAATGAHNEAILALDNTPPMYLVIDNVNLNLGVTTDVGRSLGNIPYLTILGDDITDNAINGRFFYGSCQSQAGQDIITYVKSINALDPQGALATLSMTLPPQKQYTIKIYIHRISISLVSAPTKHGVLSMNYYALDYSNLKLGSSANTSGGIFGRDFSNLFGDMSNWSFT